ncbi:hypothetical protein ABT009_30640 [Streptomyces sp. NPDC002896]|uniref:hypothetical protein n=1 Tax=Streptomyces sp. NPDC002896 TaxID=3154438 RepID=UPI0033296998
MTTSVKNNACQGHLHLHGQVRGCRVRINGANRARAGHLAVAENVPSSVMPSSPVRFGSGPLHPPSKLGGDAVGLGTDFERAEESAEGSDDDRSKSLRAGSQSPKRLRITLRKEPTMPLPGMAPERRESEGVAPRPTEQAGGTLPTDISDVTRWLCAASYLRNDHTEALANLISVYAAAVPRVAWILLTRRDRKKRARALRAAIQDLRPVDTQWPVFLGHDYVRWVRRRIGPGHPVPPHGFHLTPVLQSAATAEILTILRRVLLLAAFAVATVAGLATGYALVLPVLVGGAWAACYVDRLYAYVGFRRARWAARRPARDRRWWIGLRRRRVLRREPPERDGLVVPYTLRMRGGDQPMHHLVGGGTLWSEVVIGIDVTSAATQESLKDETEEEKLVRQAFRSVDEILHSTQGRGVIAFTPDELHRHVATELGKLIDHRPTHHPENRLDVFDVAAVSAERWGDISEAEWDSLLTLARLGTGADGASSATKEARRLLCTRIVSWDGELVAALYISFAYEHHFLRIIIRSQVINPIHPTLRTGVKAAERGGAKWHARTAFNALLDVFVLLNRLRAPLSARRPPTDPGRGPVSLREVYSSHFMDDMLQYDDARRHVDWMQRCVFRAALGFLKEHNVDISAFLQQATYILQNDGVINSGVMGDVQNQPGARNSAATMTRTPPSGGDDS